MAGLRNSTRALIGAVTSWRVMLVLLAVAGVVVGVVLGPSLVGPENGVEVKGQILEVQDGSFTLMTKKGPVRVTTPPRTEFEHLVATWKLCKRRASP